MLPQGTILTGRTPASAQKEMQGDRLPESRARKVNASGTKRSHQRITTTLRPVTIFRSAEFAADL